MSTIDLGRFTLGEKPTQRDWRDAVSKAMKGAAFERLLSSTDDGIGVEPLYQRAPDAIAQSGRAAGLPWSILQRADHPDPKTANGIALADLAGGAGGLEISVAGSSSSFGFGIKDADSAAFKALLDGVYLDGVSIRLSPGPHGSRVAPAFASAVRELGYDPAVTAVDFGLDPIGALAARGDLDKPWDEVAPIVAATVTTLAGQGFKGPFLCGDGRVYHDAGSGEAQELAAIAATAVAYLRALEASGMALDEAASAIGFAVSVDADQFLGIAKIRALRRIWGRICDACGIAAPEPRIHAQTSWRMMTRRDPWVNMLRTTVAAFAAGIGGADTVTVLPFTQALGLPDEFARRIARNTQSILQEESNIYRVADPSAGSGYIEAVTDQLARSAWEQFQAIEAEGGIVAALQSGRIQQEIEAVNTKRRRSIETRSRAITGTSAFPNVGEKPVTVDGATPWPASKPHADAAVLIEPLRAQRLAEPFEDLRDASDGHAAKTGKLPSVFLANLGRIAAFTARATWAKNMFEAGGIEAPGNDGFADADATAEAFKASGAEIACICSSDDVYEELGEATAKALKQAGARAVYLAGKPGDKESAWREAGIDRFVFEGCDVIETLTSAQSVLGLADET